MDLAPRGGHGAAGDEASAVAEGDGAALVRGEAALGRAQAEDAARVVVDDGLDAAGADHVPCGAERDGQLDAVGVCRAVAGFEVGGPDADEDRG
ncbi:hypothetical protein ASE14_10845 [Agromyces sp. Root81]|nr:hypothetical protein ASE14_10845 [Agromyces sp. Root81]